mmetsp:Transcript_21820/g.47882  ORF Transcript_21820/g.47882 Transcript_21820/m.47882 type:complete len:219 (-) Transcript_21820:74-730(-)
MRLRCHARLAQRRCPIESAPRGSASPVLPPTIVCAAGPAWGRPSQPAARSTPLVGLCQPRSTQDPRQPGCKQPGRPWPSPAKTWGQPCLAQHKNAYTSSLPHRCTVGQLVLLTTPARWTCCRSRKPIAKASTADHPASPRKRPSAAPPGPLPTTRRPGTAKAAPRWRPGCYRSGASPGPCAARQNPLLCARWRPEYPCGPPHAGEELACPVGPKVLTT